MNIENQADIIATPAVAEKPTQVTPEPSQDPLKKELQRIEDHKSGRSKREKLEYTLQRVQKQLAEIDDEPVAPIEVDKSKPLTIGEFERMQREQENRRAVDLADDIQDEVERKLVIHYLETIIKPSGNADVDLSNARAIVNARRNALIAEEAQRRVQPNAYSSAPGNPGKPPEDIFEPTAEEASMMRAPFNLTKEDVLKARQKSQG